MQLTTTYTKGLLAGTLLAAMLLAGCERASALASSVSASNSGSSSYEVVLETRAEQLDAYLNIYRSAYNLCALSAEVLKLPVKPFVVVPADYIIDRRTLIRDGKNFYHKTEEFFVDIEHTDIHHGCETSMGSNSATAIVRGDKSQTILVAKDGSVDMTAPETLLDTPASKSNDLSDYSVRKVVNGVAVRCLPKDHLVMRSQVALESCFYDASGGTLTDETGEDFTIYFRNAILKEMRSTILTTAPKLVRLGKPRDATVFNWVKSQ